MGPAVMSTPNSNPVKQPEGAVTLLDGHFWSKWVKPNLPQGWAPPSAGAWSG